MGKKLRKICSITFTGQPYTKSNQAIAVRRGRYAIITYPDYIKEYEKNLGDCAKEICDGKGIKPIEAPIKLRIRYYLKSRHVKDLQNLPKTTCDALIGSVYKDDTWVAHIDMKKLYDPKNPRVEIDAFEILPNEKTHFTEVYPLPNRGKQASKTSRKKKPKRRSKRSKKTRKKAR